MKEKNNPIIKGDTYKYIFEIKIAHILYSIFFISLLIIDNNLCSFIKYDDSYITFKIKGIGNKNIYYRNLQRQLKPNAIYINGEEQNIIKYEYYFNKTVNEVKLIWNNLLIKCSEMFKSCSDIIEMDLSNFDFSQIINTTSMLANCSSLTSINLTNINTPNFQFINRMFENCSALESIDLSYFDTSKVSWMNHMFYGCSSLKSLNISNFNTSLATDMEYLFSGCSLLTSIDLSKFDTSSSRQMHYMFSNCISLISLDLSNFNTSNVNLTLYMFSNCTSLISLNLKSFNTSKVVYMNYMFANCTSLTLLDLSNFDTSEVSYMYGMFANCTSLTSLSISNFDTSKVINLHSMFYGCVSLTSLNLSNFDILQVTNMRSMFCGCSSLNSLDLSNFDTLNAIRMHNLFDGCINLEYINLRNFRENKLNKTFVYSVFNNVPDNIVLCINNSNINILFEEIEKIRCYKIDCSDNNYQLVQKKINKKNGICIDNCLNKYEYNGKCYENCSNGYYNDNNIQKCKCELNQCFTCSNVSLSKGLCTSCNSGFYPMENDPKNLGKYFNCYENLEGYFLDNANQIFKKCYNSCEACERIGNNKEHNCLKCNTNFSIEINNNNYFNCYNKNNYDNYFTDAINSNYTSIETNKKIYEGIIDIFNKKFDILKEEGVLPIKGKDDFYYQLTTVEEELNSLEENNNTDKFSKIDLGKCENLLREKNNINENISLLIFKYEKISNISAERNLQFEIYESLNKTRLNLSICNNVTIDVYVPVKLSENFINIYNQIKNLGYDLFDENSKFYKDICIPFTTPQGTDIILSDRINYYFNNEEIQCQPNCRFSEYSFEKQNLKCKCDIESSEIIFENYDFQLKNIYKSFYDVLKYSNYNVLKCYKLAFSFNIFKNNIGNIISIAFITFFLILLFIYFIEGITSLKNDISKNIHHNFGSSINPQKKNSCKHEDIKIKNNKIIKKAQKIGDKKNIIIKKLNNKKEKFGKNYHKKSKVKIYNFPPKKIEIINIKFLTQNY